MSGLGQSGTELKYLSKTLNLIHIKYFILQVQSPHVGTTACVLCYQYYKEQLIILTFIYFITNAKLISTFFTRATVVSEDLHELLVAISIIHSNYINNNNHFIHIRLCI